MLKIICTLLFIIHSSIAFNIKFSAPKVSHETSSRLKKSLANIFLSSSLIISFQGPSTSAQAADTLPSLEKCFNAVRKELDLKDGASLIRIKGDIDEGKWDDLKLFSREYDAGFRGGVLKSAWKQLGDNKQKGIKVTNSFTFDLIGLNKASRNEDKEDAYHRLDQITQDLKDFLALEQLSWIKTKPELEVKEGPAP
mmetsp:Transcript_27491/g.26302  ORF Transcript_27491/g.26302 Transcript_27491/m.26302 type:complete len:196 (+) Transcript_27491:149-736(+)